LAKYETFSMTKEVKVETKLVFKVNIANALVNMVDVHVIS
jgi:hypothetical protein